MTALPENATLDLKNPRFIRQHFPGTLVSVPEIKKAWKTERKEPNMNIVIVNGSARKGNTLAAIHAFVKGASETKLRSFPQTNFTSHPARAAEPVNVRKDALIRMIRILRLIKSQQRI